jgi:5'-nucleotidase
MMFRSTSDQRRRPKRALLAAGVLAVSVSSIVVAAGDASAGKDKPDDRHKPSGKTVEVQLLAFNDYHGHLESTTPGTVTTSLGPPAVTVPAGGAEYLSTTLALLREGHRNSLTVAAGDLIGGSEFISGLFRDEPSVESLNAMGLDVSSVGNHEFDDGVTELLRMQNGGCHPVDGCYFPDQPYAGADFQWLAANVVDEQGNTPLPPYWIKNFQGVKVGFIGMTLEDTSTLVSPLGIQGYTFLDEAETANALVPLLKRRGAETIVVLLHEGATPTGGLYNDCVGVGGPVIAINAALDPEIDALITGHTHQPYNCVLPDPAGQPRRVTSAFSFGRVVSEINLVIDKRSGEVLRDQVTATNHLVAQTVPKDPAQTAILEKWGPIANEIGRQPLGEITGDILRGKTATGSEDRGVQSTAGNFVADAQLYATLGNGAQLALMNPGGLRSDLLYAQTSGEGDGVVTYREGFTFQPFSNILITVPMTGAEIEAVLRQQCQPFRANGQARPVLHLGVSEGFTYDLAWTITTTTVGTTVIRNCTDVSVTNMMLNGVAVDPNATYMVTVNQFLLEGGDNFTAFRTPTTLDPANRIGGGIDLDALALYLAEQGPVAPPPFRVNVTPTFVNG